MTNDSNDEGPVQEIVIHIARTGNAGSGRWTADISSSVWTYQLSGNFEDITKDRVELLATVSALESIKLPRATIKLYSSSHHVIQSATACLGD